MGRWKTVIAGVLVIADGCLKLLVVFGMVIAMIAVSIVGVNVVPILAAIATPFALLGTLAIIGGIASLRRRNWGLAIAGSVAATFPFSLLGLVALILTAFSREEFE